MPIRVRCSVLQHRYTITALWRDRSDPARRTVYVSAIHALHAIRMLIVESGRVCALEPAAVTQNAFDLLCACAHQEIDAAIRDIHGAAE